MKKLIILVIFVTTLFSCSKDENSPLNSEGTQYVEDSVWQYTGSGAVIKEKSSTTCSRILVKNDTVFRSRLKNGALSYRYSNATYTCNNQLYTFITYYNNYSPSEQMNYIYILNEYKKKYEGSSTTLYYYSAYKMQKNGNIVYTITTIDGRVMNYSLYKKVQ